MIRKVGEISTAGHAIAALLAIAAIVVAGIALMRKK